MDDRRHVILITDGDDFARKTVEHVAKEIGGRCLSLSHGNPSVLNGQQIVKLIKKSPMIPYWSCLMTAGLSEKEPERMP